VEGAAAYANRSAGAFKSAMGPSIPEGEMVEKRKKRRKGDYLLSKKTKEPGHRRGYQKEIL